MNTTTTDIVRNVRYALGTTRGRTILRVLIAGGPRHLVRSLGNPYLFG